MQDAVRAKLAAKGNLIVKNKGGHPVGKTFHCIGSPAGEMFRKGGKSEGLFTSAAFAKLLAKGLEKTPVSARELLESIGSNPVPEARRFDRESAKLLVAAVKAIAGNTEGRERERAIGMLKGLLANPEFRPYPHAGYMERWASGNRGGKLVEFLEGLSQGETLKMIRLSSTLGF